MLKPFINIILRWVYACVLVINILPLSVSAQKNTIADSSLTKKYETEAFDSSLINPNASLAIAEKEIKLSDVIDYKPGVARGLVSKGYAYSKMGDMKNALKYEQEGLDYSRRNQLLKQEGGALDNLGRLYTVLGELDKAFESYELDLKIQQEVHDSIRTADCYYNIGITLVKKNLLDEAIPNYVKALGMYRALKDHEYESNTLCFISDIYILKKEYPQAYFYIARSFKVLPNANTFSHLGTYYDDIGKEDSSLANYEAAFKIYTANGDKIEMSWTINNIATVEYNMKNYRAAERHVKMALALAMQLSDLMEIGIAEDNLAKIYALKKDFKNAYKYSDAAIKAKDSFNNVQMVSKLAELNTKFEVKETESKNNLLQKENTFQKLKLQQKNILIYGTISAFVALLIIGALLFRQSKLRAQHQKTELEQKQLRAQMNPHFIFNCLNSIQHFVVANDVKNANKYLSGFALLMRQTLENSKEGVITLRKEIEYLENYLVLEKMRFEDKFIYEILCADDINVDTIEIPAMIIQPFIENAIRHGLCYLEEGQGRLKINFYRNGNYLFCEVDDNGIGMEQSQKLKMASDLVYESHGMELTRRRLALVSKSVGSEYKIEITDKKNLQQKSTGTTILIKFPLNS